jgi:hypothetical protein
VTLGYLTVVPADLEYIQVNFSVHFPTDPPRNRMATFNKQTIRYPLIRIENTDCSEAAVRTMDWGLRNARRPARYIRVHALTKNCTLDEIVNTSLAVCSMLNIPSSMTTPMATTTTTTAAPDAAHAVPPTKPSWQSIFSSRALFSASPASQEIALRSARGRSSTNVYSNGV